MNKIGSGRWLCSLFTGVALAILPGCQPSSGASKQALPQIAARGKKSTDFIPAGWRVFKSASGDLNGDGRSDYAMILTRNDDNPESGCLESGFSESIRPVVVLHGLRGGDFKRACVSPGAVMNGKIANDFALLAVDIAISSGSLIVSNGNGATHATTFDCKYRFLDGVYKLVNFTESTGSARDNSSESRDFDLLTSNVDVSTTSGGDPETGKGSRDSSYSFYALRALPVKTPPCMYLPVRKLTDRSSETCDFRQNEWPGPTVVLSRKVNLAGGKGRWHGPADFSAVLHAVHTTSDLYVCAEITGKNLVPGGDGHGSGKSGGGFEDHGLSIRLYGGHGKIRELREAVCQSVVECGSIMWARFRLADLDKDRVPNDSCIPVAYDALDLSVQISAPDKAGAPKMVLSTSCDQEKHRGMILLTNSATISTLENWNWAKRDQ